jgi:hypothetical protein
MTENPQASVYECWTGATGSFLKCDTITEVERWVTQQLRDAELHTHLHIVVHDASEYF